MRKMYIGKKQLRLFFLCFLCVWFCWINQVEAAENGNGWQQENETWVYLDQNGQKCVGWKEINGDWYFFDETGNLFTGWYQNVADYYFYLDPDNNGKMVTGWKDVYGSRYYFDENGYMVSDSWKFIEGEYYSFDENGRMRKGWYLKGSWYFYLDPQDGWMYKGWNTIGEDLYYFDENGYMIHGRGAPHTLSLYDQRYDKGPLMVGYFEIDGIPAYCLMHDVQPPTKIGSTMNTVYAYTIYNQKNEMMRKIFYYGYGGPGQLSGVDPRTTALAASVANGYSDNVEGRGARLIQKLAAYEAPPEGFVVYVVSDGNSYTQDIGYWQYTPSSKKKKGKLSLKKSSASPTVTDGNSLYSMKGSQFGVYKDATAVSQRVGTLVTDESGKSNVLEMEEGVYYVKEERAPRGYILNTDIKKVYVNGKEEAFIEFKDVPQMNPVSTLVRKVDDETGENIAAQYGSLKGAEFTLKFYDVIMATDPAKSGYKAKAEWVLHTDEQGFCCLNENYKVSGPPLYKMQDQTAALPLGTVTIQETKAPSGYRLNPKMHVQWIKAEGNQEKLDFYHDTLIPENSVKLKLVKMDRKKQLNLSGAGFIYVNPDGVSEQLYTDGNGEIVLKGLAVGTHSLQENKAPEGYALNPTVVSFTVTEAKEVIADENVNVEGSGVVTNVLEQQDLLVEMDEPEAYYTILIHKTNDKKEPLEGARFEIYEDQNCTKKIETLKSNQAGEVKTQTMQPGKEYYMKETVAPKGYLIDPKVYKIKVESQSDGNTILFVNDKSYLEGGNAEYTIVTKNGESIVELTMINQIGRKLPATGSKKGLLSVSVFGCYLALLFFEGKRKKY